MTKKRAARRALNRFKRTKADVDKLIYKQKRAEYKSIVKEKKQHHKTSVHQALFDNKRNGSKFWDTVRRARQRKTKQPEINISTWKDHFQSVLSNKSMEVPSKENTNENPSESQPGTESEANVTHIPELDDPITEQEVRQSVRNLKQGKASGLDGICGEFLKYSENIVAPFLTELFNKLYDMNVFPSDWCKSGDDKISDSYRGISLLSIVSKVFTAVLNKRLYTWAEKEEKICKEQAGFRKGYSTIDHIFTLVIMVKKKRNNKRGGKVYVAFTDYKKAFDTVDREKLWETLQKLKTSSKMVNTLKSM